VPPEETEPTRSGGDPPAQPAPARAPSRPEAGRRHRTPRYPVFLFTGSATGLLVGVALALYGGGDTVTTGAGVLGYFSAFGLIVGALLGGTLAVVVESAMNRGQRRRSRKG